MDEVSELLRLICGLSIPFMLGVVFGREFRRPKAEARTDVIVAGEEVMAAVHRLWTNHRFVGPGCTHTRNLRLQRRGQPDVVILLQVEA